MTFARQLICNCAARILRIRTHSEIQEESITTDSNRSNSRILDFEQTEQIEQRPDTNSNCNARVQREDKDKNLKVKDSSGKSDDDDEARGN